MERSCRIDFLVVLFFVWRGPEEFPGFFYSNQINITSALLLKRPALQQYIFSGELPIDRFASYLYLESIRVIQRL